MLIHEKIRDEVIERLKPALSSQVKRFYSGRILGLNPSEQCPAISVYLEDISLDQTCLCDSELNATFNIAIYLKPHSGEDELDNIAELIRNTIYNSELESVLNISLKSYDYNYDEEQAAWISSVLQFAINYDE